MDEGRIVKISIIGAVLSLIAIFIFVSRVVPEDVKIGDISRDYVGRVISITGTVRDLNMKDGNAFFKLLDETGEVNVVIWGDVLKSLDATDGNIRVLDENMTLSLVGEVDVHSGYIQIVVTKPKVSESTIR